MGFDHAERFSQKTCGRRRHHRLGDRRSVGFTHREGHAFAAVKGDGSVATRSGARSGGDSEKVLEDGAEHVVMTSHAFAAMKKDGSVVTRGDKKTLWMWLRRRETMWLLLPSKKTVPSSRGATNAMEPTKSSPSCTAELATGARVSVNAL